jgi:hypothetical protein
MSTVVSVPINLKKLPTDIQKTHNGILKVGSEGQQVLRYLLHAEAQVVAQLQLHNTHLKLRSF